MSSILVPWKRAKASHDEKMCIGYPRALNNPREAIVAKRPTMPKSDPTIAALFETLLPIDERIVTRPMFGHKAAFVSGHMFAGTFGKHVFVRLDEPSRLELLSVAGAAPFEPMKGRPMKEYVQLPESLLDEPVRAKAWLERALHWVATLPAKGGKKGSATPGRGNRSKVRKSIRR
jgi:TfoX/Sxy family transcriptional regulator of competence genes